MPFLFDNGKKKQWQQLINGYIHLNDVVFRFVREHSWICFLLSCLYVLSILLTQPLTYGRDDIGILQAIENGQDVPFMSLLLVRFLGFLYLHISPGIPWYALFLYIVHCISITLFLKVVLTFRRLRHYVLLYILLYGLFYTDLIMSVSYNNAALMIGGNALFVFVANVRVGGIRSWIYSLYGLLFVFSYLIRVQTIKAVLVFSLPVIFFSLFNGLDKRDIKKYIYFVFPVFVIIGLNVLFVNNLISNQYRDYLEFNEKRGSFHGYDVQFEKKYYNKELLSNNNWSVTDAEALNYWFYIDERKFNIETLGNVIGVSVSNAYLKEVYLDKLSLFYEQYKRIFPLLVFPIILVMLSSIGYGVPKGAVFYCLYIISGMAYMSVAFRFPPRIGFPLILLCSTGVFLIATKDCCFLTSTRQYAVHSYKRVGILLLTSLLLASINLSWQYDRREIVLKGQQLLNRTVEQLKAFSPDSFFVAQGLSLGSNYMYPLSTYESFYQGVMLIPGAHSLWTIFTPNYYHVLGQLGVNYGHSLLPLMLDNDRAYFIVWNTTFKEFLVKFAEENLNKSCHLEVVCELPNKRLVCKLVSGKDRLSWPLFMPAIIRNNPFPWNDYLKSMVGKTPLIWPAQENLRSR